MIKNFDDIQKISQQNMDFATKSFGEWNKGWQAIAAEWTDYSKRAFEEGTQAFEKLLAAKSAEQAFEIQSSFAKRSYDEYMAQVSKVTTMCSEMAREAYKPLERAMAPRNH